jgi:hypothetical protein
MPIEGIDNALRRYRILKALLQRELRYTRGYTNLSRLFELGILERGMQGNAQEVARQRFDELDTMADALGFLDITASFEAAALKAIGDVRAATVGSLRRAVQELRLARAAPGLVRDWDEFSRSLSLILELLTLGAAPDDPEKIKAINDARNGIAHGRIPAGLPVPHDELASLLSRLIDRQLLNQAPE